MKKIILAFCDNSILPGKNDGTIADPKICKLIVIDTESEEEDLEIPVISFIQGSKTMVSQELITDLLSPDNPKFLLILTPEESITDKKLSERNLKSLKINSVNVKIELTLQKRLIMGDLVIGLRNKEIAIKRKISPHTVKNHISSILSILKARSRSEAVHVWGRQN
jgi:DNA-binding CsgD family transcriptional regulator